MGSTIGATLSVAVNRVANVRVEDRILIIVDRSTEFVVQEIEKILNHNDKKIIRLRVGEEMPRNAVLDRDVIFVFTKNNLCFSKNVARAVDEGRKVLCCSNCNPSKLMKSIPADLDKYHTLTMKLVSSLRKRASFEIISGGVHRITGEIDKFPPRYVGFLMDDKNNFSILPGGIIGVSIIPRTVIGELLINGFVEKIGQVENSVLLKIEEGNVSISNPSGAPRYLLKSVSSPWFKPCELGAGTNPNSETSEDTHESESELGIIDIGFGENKHIGGPIGGRRHFDVTTKSGTLRIDGKMIIDKGEIRL